MPDFTIALLLIVTGSLALGVLIGWLARSRRALQQKTAINAEWQEQLDRAQRAERRINRQRKDLQAELATARYDLERLSESSAAPAPVFADEGDDLTAALDECKARRDSLREQLDKFIAKSREFTEASKQKDEKIFALSRELESWQQRLPPLIERYREKDLESTAVLNELETERARIAELEATLNTRVMPTAWHDFTGECEKAPAANNEQSDPAVRRERARRSETHPWHWPGTRAPVE